MKQCPFCAEEIQDAAIVCKHCGRDLNASTKPAQAAKKPIGPLNIGCLLVFGIGLAAFFAGTCRLSAPQDAGTKTSPATAALDANVHFDGAQFTVTNKGSTDWLDIRCTVNRSGFFGEGYEYRVKRLDAGESFKVGARQFTKPDGTRFNPFEIKPTSMAISAKIDALNGPEGFFYGAWN